jgi:hypothetical protein
MKLGVALLEEAGVPFALAGRLAVWMYVPPEGQQFTKDVDFAVPYGQTDRVLRLAKKKHLRTTELDIGGFGIKGQGVAVDFIDRHPRLSGLFASAVRAARREGKRLEGEGLSVPVVPLRHLIAMKLALFRRGDERDIQELLCAMPARDYPRLRKLVAELADPLLVDRLDDLASRFGHPGPKMLKRRYAGRKRSS